MRSPLVKCRFVLWIAAASVSIVGTLLWLLLIRGERIVTHDQILMDGWIALVAILCIIALLLKTTPPDAIRLSRRRSCAIVLGVTVLFHACAIALIDPVLSEDVVRYRSDGRTWLSGRSPYAMSPAEIENLAAESRGYPLDAIDLAVPFPLLHTIYPPTAEMLFAGEAWIERALDWTPAPAAEWSGEPHPQWRTLAPTLQFGERAMVWRMADAAMAIACAAVLLILLRQMDRSPWWAVLFAWNPLVIIETSGMAHQDIAGVLLILLMLVAANRGRFAMAAMLLVLAIGVKPIVILLAPFFLRDAVFPPLASPKRIVLVILAFVATASMLALPLLYQHGLAGMLLTGRIYSQNWEANGSIYEFFKTYFGSGDLGRAMVRAKEMSRLFSVTMVLFTGLVLWQRRASLAQAGYWFLLILLLCAPVAYPWYLLWVICFVPLLSGAQGMSGLVWSGTIALCYVLWDTTDWVMPHRVLRWEYGPVAAMLVCELAVMLWMMRSRFVTSGEATESQCLAAR